MYYAVVVKNWEDVNFYFEQGKEFVDVVVEKQGFNFILKDSDITRIQLEGNPIKMEKVN